MMQTVLHDASAPFVLLDDAVRGEALLFTEPSRIITADGPSDISRAMQELRDAHAAGFHCAGFLGYDAGYGLEPRLLPAARTLASTAPGPCMWFGVFSAPPRRLPHDMVIRLTSGDAGGDAGIMHWSPLWEQDRYQKAVARVLSYIRAGDIYQANLSFPCMAETTGSALALYGRMRAAQPTAFGAVIHTGDMHILSVSPELFFSLKDGQIEARPMKGTAPRHPDKVIDTDRITALHHDPKNRAENLMITDLLRNDITRIAQAGSVKTPRMFAIETHPTLHQMTSTIHARLAKNKDAIDMLEALFPCGSITGAPKIRAMEVIAELEGETRGVYSGAIGHIAPHGDALFNVAIRTLVINESGQARFNLGSGIVADSRAEDEWQECLLKGQFLESMRRSCDLIETMAYDPTQGIKRRARHLARLGRSANALGFTWDACQAETYLDRAVATETSPRRVRLLLERTGHMTIHTSPMPPAPRLPVTVTLARAPLQNHDARLRHKTTDRAHYAKAGNPDIFDTLFVDDQGRVTEGCFTNVFVERNGQLLTPPVRLGLLPGILREELLVQGRAVEAIITPRDLAQGFFLGNALRGLIPARLDRFYPSGMNETGGL